MMPGNTCSVFTCTSNSTKAIQTGERIGFFTFPKDPQLRQEWVRRCYRDDQFDSRNKRVCSKHFKIEDYEDAMQARLMGSQPKKLKKTAIPSIYLFHGGINLTKNAETALPVLVYDE